MMRAYDRPALRRAGRASRRHAKYLTTTKHTFRLADSAIGPDDAPRRPLPSNAYQADMPNCIFDDISREID